MEISKSRKKIKPTDKEIKRAEELKNLRLKNNLSLEEVAQKLNISKVTLSRYENTDITNIPMGNIEKLAKIYKTTPGYIMGWENNLNNNVQIDPYFVDTSVLTPEELAEFEKVTGVNKQLFFNDVDDEHDMAVFKRAVIDILIKQRENKK
ncbi:helix-turn-helix domain-containing protein [Leptotrichia massiliensis]|uniref:helix-turn-helix domain-containing protein n=1 Tax=Leptotrichia massiliensis TaxID=1852388 RepID=UPI0008DADAC1|nr:helix-turn-helix transcriptional regulator [Leptotrichia massiliensis]